MNDYNLNLLLSKINLDCLKQALGKKDFKGYHYKLQARMNNVDFLLVLNFFKTTRYYCHLFAFCEGTRIDISKFKTSKKELSLMSNELLGKKLKENKIIEW